MKKQIKLLSVLIAMMLCSACMTLKLIAPNSFEATKFEVKSHQLFMDDLINSKTPDQLRRVLDDHPEVTEIVLLNVPGSVDDEANLRAAKLVRERGLNTRLLSTSMVASGGTDFFLAGVERTIEGSARVGVHSWSDSGGVEGKLIPRTDSQHTLYLDYYRSIGIPEEFYWFTLSAAPADDIHWMTKQEFQQYGVVTKYISEN